MKNKTNKQKILNPKKIFLKGILFLKWLWKKKHYLIFRVHKQFYFEFANEKYISKLIEFRIGSKDLG